MAELVLAGQRQSLGQGVLEGAELEGLEKGDQVGADRIDRPRGCGWGAHRVSFVSVLPPEITVRCPVLSVATPVPAVATVVLSVATPVPVVATVVPDVAGPVLSVANSAGSRVNRDGAADPAAGSSGVVVSVARSSIEAILLTDTTSRSSAVEHAVSTGPGP